MKRVTFGILVVFLVWGAGAVELSGNTYGDMRERGGRLEVAQNESGEWVSEIIRLDKKEYVYRITVDAENTGDAYMLFESSSNNFYTVKGKQKIFIKEGVRKYRVQERDDSRYRRIVIKAQGPTRINAVNAEVKEKSGVLPALLVLVAFGGGLLVMIAWKKNSKRGIDDRVKSVSIVLSVLLFVGAGASFTYDYSTEGNTFHNDSLNIEFEELVPGEDYVFVRNTAAGEEEVRAFTVESTGRQKFTEFISPLDNDVNYTVREGWAYEIEFSNGTEAGGVPIHYGFVWHGLDQFNDGEVQWNEYNTCGADDLTEANGRMEVIASPDDEEMGFNHRFSMTDMVIVDLTIDAGADIFYNGAFGNTTCGEELHTWNEDLTEPSSTWRVSFAHWYNMTDETFYVQQYNRTTGELVGNAFVSHGESFEEVRDGWFLRFMGSALSTNTADTFVHNYTVIPVKSFNQFSGLHTAGTGAAFYDWQGFEEDRTGPTGLEFNDGTGWESFFSDIQNSFELSFRNTLNGTIRTLYVESEAVEALETEFPRDGYTYSVNEPENITFEYNVPSNFNIGEVSWELRKQGNTDWTEFRFNLGGSDLDGNCVTQSQRTFVTDDCIGHTIVLENVDQTFEGLGPGVWEWRVKYNNSDADGDFGTTFFSNVREVQKVQAFTDVELNTPLDGVTLTTTKPEFEFALNTEQGGTALLIINDSTEKTWTVNDEFFGTLSHIPENGLSEGFHSWRASYDGNDGTFTNSTTRTFTIDTSLNGLVNFSLTFPPNGFETQQREINLTYDVDTSDSGTVEVYLGGTQVDSKSVSSGSNTGLQTDLLNLAPDEYTWALVFDNGTYRIQSNTSTFTIQENVDLSQVSPSDGANINEPPVLFIGSIDTTSAGTLSLVIDGDVRESTSVSSGFNGTKEFEVSSNLSSGKHTWRLEFESDASGDTYETDKRTFTLVQGTADIPGAQKGGQFGNFAVQLFGDPFNVSRSSAIFILSFLLLLAFTLILSVASETPLTGGVVFTGGGLMFGAIGFWPAWTVIVFAVIAAVLFARHMASRGE